MNDVTFMILKIVVGVCVALITAYVVPYLNTLRSNMRYAGMLDIISIAVRAAEQQIGSGLGMTKKERVMDFTSDWLARQGVEIKLEQLSELVEAAVYTMNNETKHKDDK